MHIPDFKIEEKLRKSGYDFAIGTDEAGRGPLAGSVVAAAVILCEKIRKEDEEWDLIRDSKTLSEKQREKAFDFVTENFYVGIGVCDHNTIDRINILEASFLAMKKALADLKNKNREIKNKKIIVLIDGNKDIPNLTEEQRAIIQGDKKVKTIAAASIIAKVTRDRMMQEANKKYPEYGFDRHKGYGTKIHMETLEKYGPCEIHRKSFAPVKRVSKNKGIN